MSTFVCVNKFVFALMNSFFDICLQVLNTEQVVEPECSPQSGITVLNNIVDKIEQHGHGQHNIV